MNNDTIHQSILQALHQIGFLCSVHCLSYFVYLSLFSLFTIKTDMCIVVLLTIERLKEIKTKHTNEQTLYLLCDNMELLNYSTIQNTLVTISINQLCKFHWKTIFDLELGRFEFHFYCRNPFCCPSLDLHFFSQELKDNPESSAK